MDIGDRIGNIGLVPVVVIDDAADAADTAAALSDGGVGVMEITLRTDAGLDAIANASECAAEVLVGAGTVLSLASAKAAVERGARFIVSPGFDVEVVAWCKERGVAVYPGCVTPTEISAALKLGLNALKFFPANVYGGAGAIKALSGPFPSVRFIPTGGVGLGNLADFAMPQVMAIGGGWLCPQAYIMEGNFAGITEVCRKSVEALATARAAHSA
ncbi:MAG: bifunctional 4-hydroxy-2-oxoglutarate aldolase/2-dehydro-3-deoxy-phosphogluconate aldolase [Clostridiales Family XIII bacterium]|jgi:2-dehydro-3-deoxyphosphogluconate aldolase/(4S)-4-hydroxy-2-oxoglutarate aldolase|nr:bifunctional 4-hydroxy-2-oxoglutarate aldolase/2-dehydro-3-deoxy-phosphogluconate aldolase [Clostridiales Family XIII bacterium]